MVDFAICLGSDEVDDDDSFEGDGEAMAALRRRMKHIIRTSDESINATPYYSMRHRPIVISIETKTESRTQEEAQVQLAIWVAAQMQRIVAFAPSGARVLENMVFPLIYVDSDKWSIFFARGSLAPPEKEASPQEQPKICIKIYEQVALGDTTSMLGVYTLLRGLRELGNWASKNFRGWWEQILA